MYSGQVIAVGEFVVNEGVPPETAQKLGVVNGASILYGAIREMVTNITARSLLGVPLILATMSFTETAEQALKEIAAKMDCSVKTIKNHLTALHKDGVVRSEGGIWKVVALSPDPDCYRDRDRDWDETCPHCGAEGVEPNAGGRLLCRSCWKYVEGGRVA